MKTIVVYESLWGNTAAVARAIAEGFGVEAQALSTAQAGPDCVAGADLIIAGAPLLGFNLPTEGMRENIRTSPRRAPSPPDLSHPSLRAWLAALPLGRGKAAAFETRLWWSPGGAGPAILTGLASAGYSPLANSQRFIVTGAYGPLRKGELERARRWGAELSQALRA